MNPANDDMTIDRDEQAATWCWRLAEGALSAAQQGEFDAWIADDPENRAAFETMVALWQGSDAIADMPGFLALRGRALDHMDRAARGRASWRDGGWRWATFAAAAAVMLLIVSTLLLLPARTEGYETGIGERRVVALKDGSRLSLDASSQVEIALGDDRRSLTLQAGRARFDVARDPFRPFMVHAGGKTVVATGTSFSVELLRGEVRVVLYEGRVEVLEQSAAGGAARPLRIVRAGGDGGALRPGEELVSPTALAQATVAAADVSRSLSWEGGRLSFVDEPLAAAVERVNRYADRPIVIADGAAGRLLVNGVFDAGDTGSFVSGIASIFPIAVREEASRTIIASRVSEAR